MAVQNGSGGFFRYSGFAGISLTGRTICEHATARDKRKLWDQGNIYNGPS